MLHERVDVRIIRTWNVTGWNGDGDGRKDRRIIKSELENPSSFFHGSGRDRSVRRGYVDYNINLQ